MSNPLSQVSADEFYDLSQDRTRRYLGGRFFDAVRIGVAISEEVAQTYSGQVLALSVANLLSRFCRHVSLIIPAVSLHPLLVRSGMTTLLDRIHAEMHGANPFGDFEYCNSFGRGIDYLLQLGTPEVGASHPDLVVDGDGWIAFIGQNSESPFAGHNGLNPIGPTAAACLAIADIFKVFTYVRADFRIRERLLSLFDFASADMTLAPPISPAMIQLGSAQMIGVGSVGSAILYLLSLMPVKGRIDLIDHQKVEWVNLDRSAIFMTSDLDRPKVDVGKEWLINSGVQVATYPMTFSEFTKINGRGKPAPDLILLLANEDNVYTVLQNNFPPLVIYGTTTSGWGVNLGRHIPLQGECVLCRYPNHAVPSYRCSTTEIVSSEHERVDASLPFLSLMAGVLATAELLKAQMDGYPFHGNFAYLDLMGPLERIEVAQRNKQADCMCSQQSPKIYRQCIKNSRWARLSI